eukprot:TRINITY_DN4077_c0_g1_i9.p1 TRINITY_DN4077_c0_g1~~TRINITY_DN4077_c0_g1_i9.p1  ORF type:complete len:104 (-),score=17.85 TRINITY_DN4077_c0_g1_i9:74-385(-)
MKTVIVLLAVIFAVGLALGENSKPARPQDTNTRNLTRKPSDPIRVNGELKCEQGLHLVKRCGPSHCSTVGGRTRCTKDYRCKNVCSRFPEKSKSKVSPQQTKA